MKTTEDFDKEDDDVSLKKMFNLMMKEYTRAEEDKKLILMNSEILKRNAEDIKEMKEVKIVEIIDNQKEIKGDIKTNKDDIADLTAQSKAFSDRLVILESENKKLKEKLNRSIMRKSLIKWRVKRKKETA